MSAPKDKYDFLYEGIQRSFRETFNAELKMSSVDLDIFYIDDFDERWANNFTYVSTHPGVGFWVHNDCDNFRLCYKETGKY